MNTDELLAYSTVALAAATTALSWLTRQEGQKAEKRFRKMMKQNEHDQVEARVFTKAENSRQLIAVVICVAMTAAGVVIRSKSTSRERSE